MGGTRCRLCWVALATAMLAVPGLVRSEEPAPDRPPAPAPRLPLAPDPEMPRGAPLPRALFVPPDETAWPLALLPEAAAVLDRTATLPVTLNARYVHKRFRAHRALDHLMPGLKEAALTLQIGVQLRF